MKVVSIQEYEGRWLLPLLEQAQRNLGPRGHIGTIVIDRGYLDGEDLWQVHQQGVIFVIVGKANMVVTQDAQALAKGERAQVRERVIGHGHGKTAREERLRTELVGIEGLTTYDDYGEPSQTQYAHRRDYQGQPINAVVVRRWDNRVPTGDGTVYLTNGPVADPFVVFDSYDWRSVIENGIWKRGQASLALGSLPQENRGRRHRALPLYAAGDGAVYRLSLVASPAGRCSCPPDGGPSQCEYRLVGRRGHGRLSLTAPGGESGKRNRLR